MARIRHTPRQTKADLLAEIERLKAVARAMVETDGREFGMVQIGAGPDPKFPFRLMLCWPACNAEAELAVARAFKAYMEEAIKNGYASGSIDLKTRVGRVLEQAWETLIEAQSFLDNPAAITDDYQEIGEKLHLQVVESLRLVGPLVVPARKAEKEGGE